MIFGASGFELQRKIIQILLSEGSGPQLLDLQVGLRNQRFVCNAEGTTTLSIATKAEAETVLCSNVPCLTEVLFPLGIKSRLKLFVFFPQVLI